MLPLLLVGLGLAAEPAVSPEVRAYLDQRIEIRRFVTAGTGQTVKTVYRRGGRSLSGPDVYELLERPDLAAAYRKRNRTNWALGAGGVVVGMAGLITMSQGAGSRWTLPADVCGDLADAARDACVEDVEAKNEASSAASKALLLLGAGLTVGGGVGVAIPLIRGAHPVREDEVQWMVGEYNTRLAQELGVSLSMTLDPWVAPTGAGVGVTVRR